VYHRRSVRERELALERNKASREQEAIRGLEQLGEYLVRSTITTLPSPNAPSHIRRACRPGMPSMDEMLSRVDEYILGSQGTTVLKIIRDADLSADLS
jgi:hypothetical protein